MFSESQLTEVKEEDSSNILYIHISKPQSVLMIDTSRVKLCCSSNVMNLF